MRAKVYASTVDTREELWCWIQQLAIEIKKTPGIFERLLLPFLLKAQLYVRDRLVNSSFDCFLLIHNTLN
jgi:hypothetical protein